jgi:hypothetical protein
MTSKLDALESECIKKLPPPPYVKGWIRLYCEQLEIDPEPFLADYQAHLSGSPGKKSVTRPAVRDLPARPLEPIHTGAKRTLPPTGPDPLLTSATKVHRIVEPAEETFTSVPKPVELITPDVNTDPPAPEAKMDLFPATAPLPTAPMPADDLFAQQPAPAPAPSAPEAFTLSSDPMPTSAAPAPAPAPVHPNPHAHHAVFSDTFEKEKRGRTIVQQRDRSDELRGQDNSRRIFSPQQPVSEPPNPVLRPILDIFKSIGGLFTGAVNRATRPKVKRMQGDEGRYATPRMFYQALLVFFILLGLTGIVFAFRYVFRLSDQAEPEYGITPNGAPTQYEMRPVATPPDPFFD